ncbi:MAG: DUF2764 family protein, partial [Cytophagales bacterium]
VDEEGQMQIKMILVKNDIRNIVNFYSNKNGTLTGNKMPYQPALMNPQELEEWTIYKDLWPEFLKILMEDFQTEITGMSEKELTRFFWGAYYNALENMNPFLKEVMQNYVIMHDILGLIRSKNLGLGLWDHWIGYESQLEDLKSGRLTLSGMSHEHENFNNLKTKTLDAEPWEAESWCDDLLIRKSQELLGHNPFDMEHLLFYTFKLLVGAKWREMTSDNGNKRFDFLKDQLISEIEIPSVI